MSFPGLKSMFTVVPPSHICSIAGVSLSILMKLDLPGNVILTVGICGCSWKILCWLAPVFTRKPTAYMRDINQHMFLSSGEIVLNDSGMARS
jgi:hypothetical protein